VNPEAAVREEALLFSCGSDVLVGILHSPIAAADTAVLIIVGGPQYRVGSHRQFVLMARRLAEAGHPVMRFDVRGMGDSTGAVRSFEAVNEDIATAMDCVQQQLPHVKRFVLWGLCDGASAALLYCLASRDPRVYGLCLLNPWVRSVASLAVTHVKHYYVQRFWQPSFWRKLISGKIAPNAVAAFLRTLRIAAGTTLLAPQRAGVATPYQRRMAQAWAGFNGHILLVLSARDLTAKEFVEHVKRDDGWKAALNHGVLEKHELSMADHTFSDATSRAAVETLVVEWLRKWTTNAARSTAAGHYGVMT
jgi:exosortase A-associated hydrolase 1